jgi:uncharacterized protein YkwD
MKKLIIVTVLIIGCGGNNKPVPQPDPNPPFNPQPQPDPNPPFNPQPTPNPQPQPTPDRITQTLTLINNQRKMNGLATLKFNDKLNKASQQWAIQMAKTRNMSHGDPGSRMRAVGYNYITFGENIAAGQQSPEEVVKAWMNSPGHRANILNKNYIDTGIGWKDGYWCQDFGKMGSGSQEKMQLSGPLEE